MKIYPWVTSLPLAVASGIMRVASNFARMDPTRQQTYLAEKFPAMPADQIVATGQFILAAVKAGKAIEKKEHAEIPVVSGVPGRTTKRYFYDTFIKGVSDKRTMFVNAAWGEEG